MARPILQQFGANHLLAAAALGLALIALWPWIASLPTNPAAVRPALPSSDPPVAVLPQPGSFAAIAERPLFSPSRRPAATAPAVSDGGLARYRLTGLVTAGGARHALITDGKRRLEIGEGSLLDTWTVLRIDADRVVLTSPRGEATLRLARPDPEPARGR